MEQTEANIRQHALESACFVVSATAWLDADQQAQIMKDTGCAIAPISGGCLTAIASPDVDVAPLLASAGYRAIVPYLRGYGTTRFLSNETPRNGQQSVVAVDVIALMNALKIEKAVIAGCDWGAPGKMNKQVAGDLGIPPIRLSPDTGKGRCALREPQIAVIDDDESFRGALVESLGSLGYGARGFASAEEFIASEADASCNCVITDVHMPGMSGLDLARLLTAPVSGSPS